MTDFLPRNDERAPNERPVAEVAPGRLAVETALGRGLAPFYASDGWNAPHLRIRRAVIMIHGRLRNADAYFRLAGLARDAAGDAGRDTVLIAPQFLAAADVAAHCLPPDTLHWDWTGWMGGDAALGPAPLSSFDVLDALLDVLGRRERFPALEAIVLAGHSGGAQVVQRYAVVARGDKALRGPDMRYVVANPSSYLYFDRQRPLARGGFARCDAARFPGFNDWKYGLERLPAYAGQAPRAQTLEEAYARRDVTMLLGSADCDPAHPALDTSSAARAQGAHRLERGLAYARYMQLRHPEGLRHRLCVVQGVGHDGEGMFTSAQGVESLFGSNKRRAE
ncbi:MAG: alpha/beta hydrolase [Bordetella sp.]|uniref:alpha/beta hydrolase n=1 Tax=Bordetella sp. TaxID=28081 RepID=UPI003F7C7576